MISSAVPNVLSLIGKTPMIEISGFSKNPKIKIYAKLEGQSIGGSVKDRIALQMIEQAEKSGILTKDKIILEATSGNTGISLAMIAAVKGYKIKLTMSSGMSEERKKILRAYGAELIETSAENGTSGAIEKARELLSQSPEKYWSSNQHNTLENPMAHISTAKEIEEQVPDITHFVGGIGTFGTLRGMSTVFREKNKKIQIVGIEPMLGEKVDGLRNMQEPNPPGIFDPSFMDQRLMVTRNQAVEMARKIAKTNGFLVGVSSGAVLWGAVEISKNLEEGRIVILFPDRGEKYLSTDLFE
ncbi:cysteine synthase family protein [Candidatus Gracilibacteria bacterium]|nr:cysteine synthase family protein [Candidatus Gracilibacteria bacterium]